MCAHHLGHRQLAGVGLLQPHAAGIHQQHNFAWQFGMIARGAEQADQLGAGHFGEGAAHELALLRRQQDVVAVERAAADDDTIIEGGGQVELGQDAGSALRSVGGRNSWNVAGVEEAGDALARGGLKPAGIAGGGGLAQRPSRLLHHGLALHQTQRHRIGPRAAVVDGDGEATGRGALDEVESLTARQMSPKPPTLVAISIRHLV